MLFITFFLSGCGGPAPIRYKEPKGSINGLVTLYFMIKKDVFSKGLPNHFFIDREWVLSTGNFTSNVYSKIKMKSGKHYLRLSGARRRFPFGITVYYEKHLEFKEGEVYYLEASRERDCDYIEQPAAMFTVDGQLHVPSKAINCSSVLTVNPVYSSEALGKIHRYSVMKRYESME